MIGLLLRPSKKVWFYIGSSLGPLVVSQKIQVPSFHLQNYLLVLITFVYNFYKIVSTSIKLGLVAKNG
jgi:hypothetical protein